MELYSNNFGARLRSLILQRGLTLVEFGEQYGLTESQVHNWLKRAQPPLAKHWLPLAKFFGVSESVIVYGRPESMDPPFGLIKTTPAEDAADEARLVAEERAGRNLPPHLVPLLSWAQLSAAATYEAIPPPHREHIATNSRDPKALAVTVEGDSMLPDFKPGDRVILAPSVEPRNGNPVLARLVDGSLVLRLFHRIDARVICLSSLRPDIYPTHHYPATALNWCWPVEELNRKI